MSHDDKNKKYKIKIKDEWGLMIIRNHANTMPVRFCKPNL